MTWCLEQILGLAEQQTLYTYQKQIEDWGWQFQAAPISKELTKDRSAHLEGFFLYVFESLHKSGGGLD